MIASLAICSGYREVETPCFKELGELRFRRLLCATANPITLTHGVFSFNWLILPSGLAVGRNQPPKRVDERIHVNASRARCVISQDTQKAGIKGVKFADTGLQIGSVADTGYLTQHRSYMMEQRIERDAGWSSPQTPANGLLHSKER